MISEDGRGTLKEGTATSEITRTALDFADLSVIVGTGGFNGTAGGIGPFENVVTAEFTAAFPPSAEEVAAGFTEATEGFVPATAEGNASFAGIVAGFEVTASAVVFCSVDKGEAFWP
jgi:hypothetical protein